MRLIIAGSRSFDDFSMLKKEVLSFIGQDIIYGITVVCGGAYDADKLGEKLAKEMKWSIKYFYPDWDTHGKKAGWIRNNEMAEYSTHCICFWDRLSKGTKMMIDIATKKKLHVKVINFNYSEIGVIEPFPK